MQIRAWIVAAFLTFALMSVLRQNLDHLAALIHAAGITRWVISPGSRNAPIVAGFIRHGGFELHSFPDERSAAFAALGMAMGDKYPAGVLCTSGSAVLNLYPAICEAYYQRIPLFVLTADRPAELIDQWDGQTIHQREVFEKHILGSFEVPDMDDTYSTLLLEAEVFQAAGLSLSPVPGPVHLNVPLRDPIYSGLEDAVEKTEIESAFQPEWLEFPHIDAAILHADLVQYKRVLLLFGQSLPNIHFTQALEVLQSQYPIFADINSNQCLQSTPEWEAALIHKEIPEDLRPDLIISFGLSFVSKALKKFLQGVEDLEHWHISPAGFVGNPFLSEPDVKRTDATMFLQAMASFKNENNVSYKLAWDNFCLNSGQEILEFANLKTYHKEEFKIVKHVLEMAGKNHAIHLANSMPVRYAGWVGNTRAEIYCNRGTSGIDGTLSTAVGYAKARPEQAIICITGDVAFFYDSHAFWCDTLPDNLKIILLNNFGGKIFDFIDGPRKELRLEKYIQTPHRLSAAPIAEMFRIQYEKATAPLMANAMANFLEEKGCKIFEIITDIHG